MTRVLKILFKLKISFKKLKEKKFLIFDEEQSDHILNYLKKDETEVMNTRKETINFWILLKCLFKFKFNYKDYLIFLYQNCKAKDNSNFNRY